MSHAARSRSHRRFCCVVAAVCLIGFVLRAQDTAPAAGQATRRVGAVDVFGYAGWNRDDSNTSALRGKLAGRVGSEVRLGASAAFRRQVQGDVVAVTGKPATDIAVVCCDSKGELNVFVGMEGEGSIPLPQRAVPTGPDALPPEALSLYAEEEKANEAANARGASAEEESQGYVLAADPAARAAQEAMRRFALAHEDVITRVLHRSRAMQQRRAAAALLGYAPRSTAQVRALEDAVNDDDDTVRNNATRALAVLASAGPLPGLNPEQIIGLLYSGVWTDRNKASALLAALTRTPNPKLLKALREQALPPLIEGARWQSRVHAFPFAVVLGRVVGMSEERIRELLQADKVSVLVEAAQALERNRDRR